MDQSRAIEERVMRVDIAALHAKEHRQKVAAETNRLVRECIEAAGGYLTVEGLVVVPNRPAGWAPLEWPRFAVMRAEVLDSRWHLKIDNNALRDKVAMFLSNHEPQISNEPGGVLVLCPAV